MALGANAVIRVNTETLQAVAAEVETSIQKLEQTFTEIGEIVDNSKGYWEGDGNNAHVNKYQSYVENTAKIFRRFRENVTDLQTIAGNYVIAENEAKEASTVLDPDIIV